MRNGQGRRRNRGPRPQQGTGTGQPPRPEQNTRMDARVRGNAHQLLEKYRNMARDATLAGDRITAEYYLQYADHYYRVLNENRPRAEEGRQRQSRDWQDRDDQDLDEEDGETRAAEPAREPREERGARDGRDARTERPRGDWAPRAGDERRDSTPSAGGSARSHPGGEDERAERATRFERSDRDRFDADRPRDERDLRRSAGVRDSARPAPGAEPGDGDDDGGMIALAALPPAISRPAAHADEDERAPAARRTRRSGDRDEAPGTANGAAGASAEPAAAAAPKRRGRPPKARPAETDPAPLEDA
jgi:hypothetical protein